MGTDQDITNINTIGEDALRGGAGDAAVTYDVTSGLEQVARRRIGALATRMSMVVCLNTATAMTDPKNTVPSIGMEPDKVLVLGGGTASSWTTKVHRLDTLTGGVGSDLAEVGLILNGARSGIELHGGWADSANSAALGMQHVAANVVCNRSREMAFEVLPEPNNFYFSFTALKDVPLVASTAGTEQVTTVAAELAAADYGMGKQIGMLDARPELRVVGAGVETTAPDALEGVVGVRRAGGRRQEGAEAAVHEVCRLVSAHQAKVEAPPPELPPGWRDQRRHASPCVGQAARRRCQINNCLG